MDKCGNLRKVRSGSTIAQRLDYYSMPEPNSGCWLWMGTVNPRGYGILLIDNVPYRIHRLQWERFNGVIPKGLFICHKCDTPSCINPDHLFMGTHNDNMRDGVNKGRFARLQGIKHPSVKLTEQEVRKIRRDKREQKDIAADYGVCVSCISQIKNYKRWAHLK